MSTLLRDGRDPTDDELSFERLASEIEQLWRSERPELAKPVPIPIGDARTPPKGAASPIVPRRSLFRARQPSPAKTITPPAKPPEPVAALKAPATPPSPPTRTPVRREPSPFPVAGKAAAPASADPFRGRAPALLPLCRPDVKIMVGETVAVLNWSTHDDRPILMPIGLDGLEQLAHAVANALAEALAKDLQRNP